MTAAGARRWALVLAAVALPASALAAQLDIELTGIENDHGLVRVADIPPGRYAVQAYHDEDGNGRLRKGLFGLPTEAIGFSRDARVRLGAPSFDEAAIDVAEPSTATRLRLRHLGP